MGPNELKPPARRSPRDDRAAVDKALSLLTAFGADAQTGVGVSELARRADMSKSTAHRILGILERNHAVERAGVAYRLGNVFSQIGAQAESAINDVLRDLLTPFLADLFHATHQTVHLAVLQGTEVVYLNKLNGHRSAPSPGRVGARIPAYCTAVGKVLLAHNPAAADATLRSERNQWTENTITGTALLEIELETVRRDGQAIDRGELMRGLHCLAGAVIGPSGRPVAAFSVSGPANRFSPEDYSDELRRLCYAAGRALLTSRNVLSNRPPALASLRHAS